MDSAMKRLMAQNFWARAAPDYKIIGRLYTVKSCQGPDFSKFSDCVVNFQWLLRVSL